MAFSVIQAGTSLQLVDTNGALTTLTLPTGVTLSSKVPPRFATFNRYVVMVNSTSRPITIDGAGTVRVLCPLPPGTAPVTSSLAGGALTGTYLVKQTFVVLDSTLNIIAESDLGPVSNSTTVSSAYLKAATLPVCPDTVSATRLYRTTNNGAVYFQWLDLQGNTQTSVADDLADAGLSLLAAPILGTPPSSLTLISEFRGRLFGVSSDAIDNLRYTEAGLLYAWPADNILPIPSIGSDKFGVTALVPRREALGAGRLNQLTQVTGTGAESAGIADFNVVILSKELGILSQESVAVYRDTAYFLWYDGVYQWNSDGLRCISDGQNGRGQVRSWFQTDSYFNRGRFQFAFAHIDVLKLKYRLFLAAADSNIENRWVEYDLDDGTWWGPHKTGLTSPTSAFTLQSPQNVEIPVIGCADDNLYKEQQTKTDGTSTAIDFDVISKRHDIDEPDYDKYFGELSIIGKAQTAGVLTVTSLTGELGVTTDLSQSYDMTKNRQRLGRLGRGKHTQLEFKNAVAGEEVELYGYELNPVHIIGRR